MKQLGEVEIETRKRPMKQSDEVEVETRNRPKKKHTISINLNQPRPSSDFAKEFSSNFAITTKAKVDKEFSSTFANTARGSKLAKEFSSLNPKTTRDSSPILEQTLVRHLSGNSVFERSN